MYINHSGMPGICTHTKSQHSLSPKPLHLAPGGVPKSVQGVAMQPCPMCSKGQAARVQWPGCGPAPRPG